MATNVGDYVQVLDRAPTPADTKSGLFYNHFRNLAGTVDRVYDDGNLCVIVDYATLSTDMMFRLKRSERLIKPRWKTGGPEEPVAPPPAETAVDEDGGDESEEGESTGVPTFIEAADEDRTEGKQGLRYAIVLKAEDVRVLSAAEQTAIKTGNRQAAAVRVSEEELKGAEARHMEELLRRTGQ